MKLLLFAIAAGSTLVHAGEPGVLEGSIRDGSDGLVPATTISCFEEETGFRFVVRSGADGQYRLMVPPGHYKVIAHRDGFRAIAQIGVLVPAGGTRRLDFRLEPGSVSETITVSDQPIQRAFADSDGAYVVRPDELRPLPQNDRTVSGLMQLAPGMLVTPANGGEPGQFSSLGARPNTNRYTVDGVSANNAVAGGGWPSFLPGARLPAMTALGTTHDLALFDAIEEVRVVTQGFNPESGRAPGGNIAIQTKSGSNDFHGSLFYALRPAPLEANDWFANRYPIAHGDPALHNEGGTVGGPIRRDRTFFFIAAERLDLRQVYSWTTTVPSIAARELSPASLKPFLDQFPLPNGPLLNCATCFGIAELIGSSARPAGLTSASVRLDHAMTARSRAFLRFALTPSWSESGFIQTNLTNYRNTVSVLGVTRDSSAWTQDTRASFSRVLAASRWLPVPGQSAGGDFYSQFPSFAADFSSISVGGAGSIEAGQNGTNRQDQIELSHSASLRRANHKFSVGLDYLQLRPVRSGPVSNYDIAFSSPTDLVLGWAAPLWVTYSSVQTTAARLHQLSGFAQDMWRIHPRVDVTVGARLLSAFAPHAVSRSGLFSVNEAALAYSPIPAGTPLWHDAPLALDPTVSLAWRFSDRADTTLRASWTSFHDGDFGVATDQLNGSPNVSLRLPQTFPAFEGVNLIPVALGYGFVSNLRVPVYRRWDVTLQHAFSRRDSIAVAYSGLIGSGLLRRDTIFYSSGPIGQLSFATNNGASSYHGLNVVYKHALARGLQTALNYSWAHSIDLGSSDSVLFLVQPGRGSLNDRGSSDFDVRHVFNGTVSYALPGKWVISSFITARSGFPIDILLAETLNGSAISNYRPDLVRDVPLWITDPQVPGGQRLNPAAFRAPAGMGNLGRNAIRGFGAWQSDVALERPFQLLDRWKLLLRAEAFNAFNHAQFADPTRYLENPLFGISESPLNLMLGSGSPVSGQSPAFQMGGPRSIQMSVRLIF